MYRSNDLVVHRSRFYIPEMYSINCIAYNQKDSKVALLRRRIRKYQPSQKEMHSLIEIWNLQNKASFLEQVIFDDTDNLALLENVVWSKSGRLFSCGLNTYINEYDLESGRIKQSSCVNSSPAWCLAIDQSDSLIAVGTEDGHICVYNLFDDCLQYDKILDRNDNRILCLEWFHPKSSSGGGDGSPLLVGGSIDYIKIWNYLSGRCIDFIKVGNTGVVVWCLKVLADFTIVSGDSNGTTSFWNGSNATLNGSFKAHRGDVLAVCASPDNQHVYSAGVDPSIIQFNRKAGKSDSWVVSTSRRPHSHDVRSLVCTENNCLLSGGVDSSFVLTSKSSQIDHLSNYSHKLATVSTDMGSYVCLQYEEYVQIWKLGTPENDFPENVGDSNAVQVTPLKIVDNAAKLLEIHSRRGIIASAFNAHWLVYANYDNIKVISWTEESIEKVKLLHDPVTNVRNMCITSDNRLVTGHGKSLETFKLDKFGVLAENSLQLKSRIHQITATEERVIVSLADKENTISIFSSSSLQHLASFSGPLLPSSMKVNTFEPNKLWIALPNAMLLQYDLNSLSLSQSYALSKYKSNENIEGVRFGEHWPIKQIAFGDQLVLYSSDHNLYCLHLAKQRITKCNKYQHVLFMDNIGPQELVVFEATPQMLLNLLPATMASKSFGT